MSTGTVLLIVIVVLAIIMYSMYNGLIKSKNKVKESFSGIDVQLKKRHDVIPNILHLAKTYMEYEERVLSEITDLRTQALNSNKVSGSEIKQKLELENRLEGKVGNILLNAENYPDLKSSDAFKQAMDAYSDVEEHIAAARRFYNAAVIELNNKVEIFPSSIIAKMLNITEMPFFEATEEEKKSVNAKDFF